MIKGYRTANGYQTVKDQKEYLKRMKKQRELDRIKKEQDQEKEIQYKTSLYYAEKKEQGKAEQQREIFFSQCKNFVKYASEFLTEYKIYLIAWDIANIDRYSIEADIYKNKITKEEITKVYNLAKIMIDDIDKYLYIADLII